MNVKISVIIEGMRHSEKVLNVFPQWCVRLKTQRHCCWNYACVYNVWYY